MSVMEGTARGNIFFDGPASILIISIASSLLISILAKLTNANLSHTFLLSRILPFSNLSSSLCSEIGMLYVGCL